MTLQELEIKTDEQYRKIDDLNYKMWIVEYDTDYLLTETENLTSQLNQMQIMLWIMTWVIVVLLIKIFKK